jgi:hypothetical protein
VEFSSGPKRWQGEAPTNRPGQRRRPIKRQRGIDSKSPTVNHKKGGSIPCCQMREVIGTSWTWRDVSYPFAIGCFFSISARHAGIVDAGCLRARWGPIASRGVASGGLARYGNPRIGFPVDFTPVWTVGLPRCRSGWGWGVPAHPETPLELPSDGAKSRLLKLIYRTVRQLALMGLQNISLGCQRCLVGKVRRPGAGSNQLAPKGGCPRGGQPFQRQHRGAKADHAADTLSANPLR